MKRVLIPAITIIISLNIIFAQNTFQKGSPKQWSRSKIQNYYNQKLLKRTTSIERPKRRSEVMAGNSIRTLVFDFGSVGAPGQEPSLEWPIYSHHGYGYEFGPLVGIEVPVDTNGHFFPYKEEGGQMVIDQNDELYDTTFFIISDGLIDGGAPGASEELSPENEPWGWEPLAGYAAEESNSLALYTKPESWPENWENWPGTYKANASTADEAIYYVMDDRFNQEFPFYPFKNNQDVGGMGLRVQVRAYQWANVLASDAIFFVYEITNTTENDYEKVVFGMFGDPHIGGSNDFSDDYAYFDTDVNMVYGYDGDNRGEWGGVTGWFGYSFLESPGNPYDGIDNDGDGMIDESMFNGIDDDGDWNEEKHDVGMDGIGPDDPTYPGPDEGEGDGVPTSGDRFDPTKPGEPNFDVSDLDEADQIGLTSFNAYQYGSDAIKNDKSIWNRLKPYTQVGRENAFTDIAQNADNIFLYGSGYFPLKAGDTKRFSVALLMGENEYDLFNTANVVQNIYDSGYRFAKPPEKPTLEAIAGDGKVTLYWDDIAEYSWDPVYGYDFQGYAIYRSTDPGFNEVHTITDNSGIATFWQPIVRFDLKDGIKGESFVGINGIHYNLGRDTGLKHEYTDTTVTNGVKYYYAICSYDIGDTTGTMEIPPSECTKTINKDAFTGQISFDKNTLAIVPQAYSPGLTGAGFSEDGLQHFGPGTGELSVKILNNSLIRNDIDYVISFKIITDGPADTVFSVTDQTIHEYELTPENNGWIQLPKVHITDVEVLRNNQACDTSLYIINTILGRVKFSSEIIGENILIKYKYQPVFENTYFDGEDGNTSFDGMRIILKDDKVEIMEDYTGWTKSESNMGHLVEQWYEEADKYPNTYKIIWDEEFLNEPTEYGQYAPFRVYDITFAYKDSTFLAPFLIIGAVSNTFNFKKSSIGILKDSEQSIENTTWQFINLPPECTIRIYTVAGELVRKLEHNSTMWNGAEYYNLLNNDNQEIGFGMYLWHVDAKSSGLGTKTGKFAVIK